MFLLMSVFKYIETQVVPVVFGVFCIEFIKIRALLLQNSSELHLQPSKIAFL